MPERRKTPYQKTLDWLYSQLPAYQKIGAKAFKKDLTNIRALCAFLEQPQERFTTIHIAGTNGKGSVAHMLAAVFQAAGYRTGLYTSPHLIDFRERIKVDGRYIPKNSVIAFTGKMQALTAEIRPSFFEMTVAMAFDHFAKKKVDIAIIETGLGGRLDSTNIILPILSVITNIGLEHTEMLGDTLEAIAGEKAGIIKPSVPVVVGSKQLETAEVFRKKAGDSSSDILFAEELYPTLVSEYVGNVRHISLASADGKEHYTLQPDLSAAYQAENIRTVLSAVKVVNAGGRFHLPEQAVLRGLQNVCTLTNFQGRWQRIASDPAVILDGAHNAAGLAALQQQLRETPYDRLHIIFGCVQDKDLSAILPLLPDEAHYYLTEPEVERKRALYSLVPVFEAAGKNVVYSHASPSSALAMALARAESRDLILITGSLFLLGSFLSRSDQP